MEKELREILKKHPDAKFRVKYIDYQIGRWTVSIKLTNYRIDTYGKDLSVEKCEVILPDGETITLTN